MNLWFVDCWLDKIRHLKIILGTRKLSWAFSCIDLNNELLENNQQTHRWMKSEWKSLAAVLFCKCCCTTHHNMLEHSKANWYCRVSTHDLFWDITWLIYIFMRVAACENKVCAPRSVSAPRAVLLFWLQTLRFTSESAVNLISHGVHR